MNITKLDHVNVRTNRLDKMVEWYTNFVGLKNGDRPRFSFPGAWLYAGDQAIIHLVGADGDAGAGAETPLKLEHFALSATGQKAFEEKLAATGEKFSKTEITDFNIIQYNVWDPDGNHIHIDFPLHE